MQFDEANKVIISTMNKDEAKAFIKFLQSEILRHGKDIEQAKDLIIQVCQHFNICLWEGK